MIKTRLFNALEDHKSKEFIPVQIFLSFVTLVSILSIVLETVPSLEEFMNLFLIIEWFSVIIFTMEFLSRVWVNERKLVYIFSFWGLIDIVSILPTYLGLANLTFLKSGRTLRILRFTRILRMGKIFRSYFKNLDMDKRKAAHNQINIAIYFLALASATTIFGSILYVIEHPSPAYANIPLAMLQVVVVLFGGVWSPSTTLSGEIVILITRLVGLALFGLLISIIGGVLNEWLLGQRKD